MVSLEHPPFRDAPIITLLLQKSISPNITVELNERGELIGIEILQASSFIRDSILEAAQAKMLDLPAPPDNRLGSAS